MAGDSSTFWFEHTLRTISTAKGRTSEKILHNGSLYLNFSLRSNFNLKDLNLVLDRV